MIPPGLNLAGMAKLLGRAARLRLPRDGRPTPSHRPLSQRKGRRATTIGYLARVCPDKGLHQLADALQLLAADADVPPVRGAGGRLSRPGRPALPGRNPSGKWPPPAWPTDSSTSASWIGPAKIAFLQSLDLFCLPTVYRESKGLSVFEAWANGVPAVLPAHGAFPEMVADTGGGLLCEPGDPAVAGGGPETHDPRSRFRRRSAAAGLNRPSTNGTMRR